MGDIVLIGWDCGAHLLRRKFLGLLLKYTYSFDSLCVFLPLLDKLFFGWVSLLEGRVWIGRRV